MERDAEDRKNGRMVMRCEYHLKDYLQRDGGTVERDAEGNVVLRMSLTEMLDALRFGLAKAGVGHQRRRGVAK